MKVLIIRKGEVSQINICSAQYIKWSNPIFGPSELRALPLGVAGRTKWPLLMAFFSFFLSSPTVTFLPEGVVLGF